MQGRQSRHPGGRVSAPGANPVSRRYFGALARAMSGLVQLPERFMTPLVAQKRSGVYNSTNNFD
jgi:hypothetical protein